MTVSVGVVIWCNGRRGKCALWIDTGQDYPAAAVELAASRGWVEHKGLHYCPRDAAEVDAGLELVLAEPAPQFVADAPSEVVFSAPYELGPDGHMARCGPVVIERTVRLCHHPRGSWTAKLTGAHQGNYFACPDCPTGAFTPYGTHLVRPWVFGESS